MKRLEIRDTYVWFVVVAIYALCVYFLGKPSTPTETFLSASNLLFWLYLVSSILWALAMIIFYLVLLLAGPTLIKKGFPSKAFDFLSSRNIFKGLARFVVVTGSLVVGAYLFGDSLTVISGEVEWNVAKLVIGTILLVTGIIKGGGYLSFKPKATA